MYVRGLARINRRPSTSPSPTLATFVWRPISIPSLRARRLTTQKPTLWRLPAYSAPGLPSPSTSAIGSSLRSSIDAAPPAIASSRRGRGPNGIASLPPLAASAGDDRARHLDGARQGCDRSVDLRFRRLRSEREAHGADSFFQRQAHRQQHVRRLPRYRSARRAAGGSYAQHIKRLHQLFAIDTRNGEAGDARQHLRALAVQARLGEGLPHAGDEPRAQRRCPADVRLALALRQLQR